jgi:hypothetical protein
MAVTGSHLEGAAQDTVDAAHEAAA